MKTVLVTGVNGFVGNHLAKELAGHGLRVVGIGGSQGATEKPQNVSDYRVMDLLDIKAVLEIDFTKVDSIIHLAGLAAVGPSFDDPMGYITANMGIQSNLFEAAIKQGALPKFVIVSSGALYDPKAATPFKEDSSVVPSSPYAVSKLGQEQMAQYYQSRGFDCVVVRPFNHIGPGQNTGFIVPDLAKQIVEVEHGRTKKVLVGNLEAKRDYTDVRDIVRAYRLLLEKGRPGEIYNVCSGTAVSGDEILDALLSLSKSKPEVAADKSKLRPSDAPVLFGSHAKLTKDTGWQPEISLQQTLSDVMNDWRSRA